MLIRTADQGIGNRVHRYKHTRTTTVSVGTHATADELGRILNDLIEVGKIYYLYAKDRDMYAQVEQLYGERSIARFTAK